MLAALAYTLMQRLLVTALQQSELASASAATIRVRLLKIGASILRNADVFISSLLHTIRYAIPI